MSCVWTACLLHQPARLDTLGALGWAAPCNAPGVSSAVREANAGTCCTRHRFPHGESGADVYDRMTIFQDHLVRDINAGECMLLLACPCLQPLPAAPPAGLCCLPSLMRHAAAMTA